jgi:superfamily II DNA helicase RecQ
LGGILVNLIGKKRTIVYTDFVKDVAPVAIALRERGLSSWSYHGKNMSSHDKLKAVDNWCPEDSTIQIMVCTTAFGMGVDVPSVDQVIRVGCPPSLEELVQEFGRAGRDGREAKGKAVSWFDKLSVCPLLLGHNLYRYSSL